MKVSLTFIFLGALLLSTLVIGEEEPIKDIEDGKSENCEPFGTCLPCTKKEMVL